jgi:hypothetical protein
MSKDEALTRLADRVRSLLLVDATENWKERTAIANELDALAALSRPSGADAEATIWLIEHKGRILEAVRPDALAMRRQTYDYATFTPLYAAPPLPEPVAVAPDLSIADAVFQVLDGFTQFYDPLPDHSMSKKGAFLRWISGEWDESDGTEGSKLFTEFSATLSANLDAMKAENRELQMQDDPAFTHAFKRRAEAADAEVARLTARVGELEKGLESIPQGAINALRDGQRQLDMDGCEVGVSRQAVDEVLAGLDALLPAKKEG